MAGALHVTLEKPAAYRLGRGPMPVPADIERSIALANRAAVLTIVGLVSLVVLLEKYRDPGVLASLSS